MRINYLSQLLRIKMASYLVFLCTALLFYKVHSQACGPVILPPLPPCPPPIPPCISPPIPPCIPSSIPPCPPIVPPCPQPCLQVVNQNPLVTTIIDNSVSNALVNALQLMIVSNLIGSANQPTPCSSLLDNLGPLLDSIVCQNPCAPVEVIYEYVPPEYSPPCQPYVPFPNYDNIPPCGPITTCYPNFDFIQPCGPVVDAYPPCFSLTDLNSPNFIYTENYVPIFSNCIDTLPTNIFNGYTDSLCPLYALDIAPNYCGGFNEIITPNFYPVNEICPYYGGFADTISPTIAALAPNMFGCPEMVASNLPFYNGLPELIPPFGPLATLAPNCFGGLTEIPLPAELVYPPSLPALTCNVGYSPSTLPCVRVNVEPFPFEPCVCNGYGGPIYF